MGHPRNLIPEKLSLITFREIQFFKVFALYSLITVRGYTLILDQSTIFTMVIEDDMNGMMKSKSFPFLIKEEHGDTEKSISDQTIDVEIIDNEGNDVHQGPSNEEFPDHVDGIMVYEFIAPVVEDEAIDVETFENIKSMESQGTIRSGLPHKHSYHVDQVLRLPM